MLSGEMLQYIVEAIESERAVHLREQLGRLSQAPSPARAALEAQLARPLCGLQLILVGDFLQVVEGWRRMLWRRALLPACLPCRLAPVTPACLACLTHPYLALPACRALPYCVQLPPVSDSGQDLQKKLELAVQNLDEKLVK